MSLARTPAVAVLAIGMLVAAVVVACASSAGSETDAEALLRAATITRADLGAGYAVAVERFETNEEVGRARPDSQRARQQHAEWGQVLQYNVQLAAEAGVAPVYSGRIAHVSNTAVLFEDRDGAAGWMAYVRSVDHEVVAGALINDGEGTRIEDTQVVAQDFPSFGDESFALRLGGKAAGDDGTATFVADTVYVRAGRIAGSVTVVSLGQPAPRDEVERLVRAFVEKMRSSGQ